MNEKVFDTCKKIPIPNTFIVGKEYIFFNYVSKKKDFKKPEVVVVTDTASSSGGTTMIVVKKKNGKNTFSPNVWTVFEKDYLTALETQYFRLLSFYKPEQLLKKDLKFMSDFKNKYPEYTI